MQFSIPSNQKLTKDPHDPIYLKQKYILIWNTKFKNFLSDSWKLKSTIFLSLSVLKYRLTSSKYNFFQSRRQIGRNSNRSDVSRAHRSRLSRARVWSHLPTSTSRQDTFWMLSHFIIQNGIVQYKRSSSTCTVSSGEIIFEFI